MKVLVACEFSGTVRDAFTAAGHDAMSCDLDPTLTPGKHYQGDALDLAQEPFDLVIAHPPCTYLSLSGVRWLHERPGRWQAMEEGAEFFATMFQFNAPLIAVENPVQHRYAIQNHGHGKPDQYVEPWQYGDMASKKTGLWLNGLPLLEPTHDVSDDMTDKHWNAVHYASGKNRGKIRSIFYPGIAKAMAEQWGQS